MDASNKSCRIVELLDWQVTARFSGQFEWLYQQDVRSNGDDLNWLSVGARPEYALFDRFKRLANTPSCGWWRVAQDIDCGHYAP